MSESLRDAKIVHLTATGKGRGGDCGCQIDGFGEPDVWVYERTSRTTEKAGVWRYSVRRVASSGRRRITVTNSSDTGYEWHLADECPIRDVVRDYVKTQRREKAKRLLSSMTVDERAELVREIEEGR